MTPKAKKGPASPASSAAAKVRESIVVPAGLFKNTCLELMDDVRESLKEYVITKHGTPVAKLVGPDVEMPSAFGFLGGTVVMEGDIVSPDSEAWPDFES